MSSKKIQIEELRLRVPGLSRTQAQQLGRLVAKRLSEMSIPVNRSRRLSAVSVSVRSSGGSLEAMAGEIANRIGGKVR